MSAPMHTGFDRTYCYPNTHVLKNQLNIHDSDKLHQAERQLTSVRIHELRSTDNISSTFDTKHLKTIHKHIFQDLYDWAGKFRTVDIAKGNMFCRFMFMESQLDYIFSQLHKEKCLENINNVNHMGERLAYYLSEINAVHPFREGNGRTQRELIRKLAEHNGYHLDYSKIPDGALLQASIKSFTQNYDDMTTLITNALTKQNPTNNIPKKSSHKKHVQQAEEISDNIQIYNPDNGFELRK